mgnify:CR=1 FL=1
MITYKNEAEIAKIRAAGRVLFEAMQEVKAAVRPGVSTYELDQIAEAAIPKCALVCITGASDMRSAIQGYYEVLYQANPDSIGGGIPDDAFYYEG